jgi:hypothetical protein
MKAKISRIMKSIKYVFTTPRWYFAENPVDEEGRERY